MKKQTKEEAERNKEILEEDEDNYYENVPSWKFKQMQVNLHNIQSYVKSLEEDNNELDIENGAQKILNKMNQHERDMKWIKELEKKDETCEQMIEYVNKEKEHFKRSAKMNEKEASFYKGLYNTKVQELYPKEPVKSK